MLEWTDPPDEEEFFPDEGEEEWWPAEWVGGRGDGWVWIWWE